MLIFKLRLLSRRLIFSELCQFLVSRKLGSLNWASARGFSLTLKNSSISAKKLESSARRIGIRSLKLLLLDCCSCSFNLVHKFSLPIIRFEWILDQASCFILAWGLGTHCCGSLTPSNKPEPFSFEDNGLLGKFDSTLLLLLLGLPEPPIVLLADFRLCEISSSSEQRVVLAAFEPRKQGGIGGAGGGGGGNGGATGITPLSLATTTSTSAWARPLGSSIDFSFSSTYLSRVYSELSALLNAVARQTSFSMSCHIGVALLAVESNLSRCRRMQRKACSAAGAPKICA